MKNDNLAYSTIDLLNSLSEPTKEDLASEEDQDLEPEKEPTDVSANQKLDNDHITDPFLLYTRNIDRYPRLTKEKEQELLRFGELGRKKVLVHNLHLVVKIAKKYTAGNDLLLDLIQDGNIGLLHAMDKFDCKRGFRFSTYATWWIRQACAITLSKQLRTIRVPSNVLEGMRKIKRVETKLRNELGRKASSNEVAKQMGLKAKVIDNIKKTRTQKTISLSLPVGENYDSQLQDFIADDYYDSPEDLALKKEYYEFQDKIILKAVGNCDSEKVFEIIRRQNILSNPFPVERQKKKHPIRLANVLKNMGISKLTENERRFYILTLRRKDFSLEYIGNELGVTRERIRKIEENTLKKIAMVFRSETMNEAIKKETMLLRN